jgi:hypothetical protein
VTPRSELAARELAPPFTPAPRQATTDARLIDLWLHGRASHTQRAYGADSSRFLAFVARPLATVTLGDVQAADSLTGKPSSRARTLAAVKSLLAFGQRTGYAPLNVGAVVKSSTLTSPITNSAPVKTKRGSAHVFLRLCPSWAHNLKLSTTSAACRMAAGCTGCQASATSRCIWIAPDGRP